MIFVVIKYLHILLQNQLWAVGEEVCCPFKHHVGHSLRQLLHPSSEVVLQKIHCLVDAGDYTGACRVHLDSLAVESCSDHSCSYSAVESCRYAGADKANAMDIEDILDSGYDSAQSSWQVHENNCSGVPLSHGSESADADNGCILKNGSMTSNVPVTKVSCTQQQCIGRILMPSKPSDHGICSVHHHLVRSGHDVAHKLHSPVEFYVSFNALVAGLLTKAVS